MIISHTKPNIQKLSVRASHMVTLRKMWKIASKEDELIWRWTVWKYWAELKGNDLHFSTPLHIIFKKQGKE